MTQLRDALDLKNKTIKRIQGELYRSPGCLHTRTGLSSVPKTNRDSSLNTTFCQSVIFHLDLAWHHCRRSCRCSGVKESARKWRLDLRFASARCLEIVCGTIATPTSARIVERVTVGSTSACRMILRSSVLVVCLVAPDPVFCAWVPSRVHCFQQFLTVHSKRCTWPATRRVDQPAVFIPIIRSLLNSLNCEKCPLALLSGMFRLPKSSYDLRVIVPFMNLRISAGLYSTLYLIVAPPRCVCTCVLEQNLDHLHMTLRCTYLQSFAIVLSFLLGLLFSMFLSVCNNLLAKTTNITFNNFKLAQIPFTAIRKKPNYVNEKTIT
ncbi:UNVERIFIED_CONTAM: hypothetical protein NCL1_34881 [Trichonephila clavipes]